MKKTLISLVAALLVMWAVPGVCAVPGVSITGLEGASHWLLFECEDGTIPAGYGSPIFVWQPAISGNGSNGLNNVAQIYYGGSAPSIEWSIQAPAAMSANTKVMMAGGAHGEYGFNILVDGAKIGEFPTIVHADYGISDEWNSASVSSGISAGSHTIKLDGNVPWYSLYGLDCVLLYDGDISTSGHPVNETFWYGSNYQHWMNANMVANSVPVINAASVTPEFAATGALGVNYYVRHNGVVSSYVLGTALTEAGDYRIWAEAWGSTAVSVIPQQRILAGADFAIAAVPEPSSMVVLFGGLVTIGTSLVRRRMK